MSENIVAYDLVAPTKRLQAITEEIEDFDEDLLSIVKLKSSASRMPPSRPSPELFAAANNIKGYEGPPFPPRPLGPACTVILDYDEYTISIAECRGQFERKIYIGKN